MNSQFNYYNKNEHETDYKDSGYDELNDSHDEDLNNKYFNLGLSLKSQELICEFHQVLGENDNKKHRFEEIIYSFLEDIQKYKHDIKRIELACKNEKEKNEESMKQMIEEAEQQLLITVEKLKKAEKAEYEKFVEKLKKQHDNEISSLQENLSKMQSLEKKYHQDKLGEDSKCEELKKEIENLCEEKSKLKINLRESCTQVSVLRSEIAQLKTLCNEKDLSRRDSTIIGSEFYELKNQIQVLQETNKKLNDTNDVLLSEIVVLKSKNSKNSEKHTIFANNLLQETSAIAVSTPNSKFENLVHHPTYIPSNSSIINTSFDTDIDEIDSGNWTGINDNSYTENFKESSPTSESNKLVAPDFLNFPPKFSGFLNGLKSKQEIQLVPKQNPPPATMFKLVFAGDSAVGKTSFIMRYCRGEFTNSTNSTLGVDFYMKLLEIDGKSIQLQLWDTCGQERFRSIAKSYFRRADGVVLMYDCTYERSFLNVREWVESINEMSDKNIPIIIIGNKIDLRDEMKKNGRKIIEYQNGYKLAKEYNALFIETSTKEGTNIEESLIELSRIMNTNQDIELKATNIKLGMNDAGKKKSCC